MTDEIALGASAEPTGLSPSVEPASAVSPPDGASIPSAEELATRLADPEFQRGQSAAMLATRVGASFRLARIARGLTVSELAAIAGCGERMIRKLERGEYVDALRPIGLLAHALDVEVEFRCIPRAAAQADAQGVKP